MVHLLAILMTRMSCTVSRAPNVKKVISFLACVCVCVNRFPPLTPTIPRSVYLRWQRHYLQCQY